ncbi:MAG: tetratricopeptide repeat protein, partial [Planctomycetota bacterium]
KAEHRHELKTNELARWIANFPNWAKENVKPIIYVSTLVIVVAAVLFWMYEKRGVSARKQIRLTNLISQISQNRAQIIYAQTQGIDASYMLIRIADELQATVQDTKNDHMVALALIKQAEALRTELHYRLGAVRPQEVVTQLNQAMDGYKNAAKKCSTNPSLMAMAQLGVGLCVEDLGNFDQARQIYNDIATNTDLESTVAAAQAKLRLDTMADYQQKVAFSPAPKAADKVLQPQIKLEAPEVPQTESNEVQIPAINQAAQIPNSVPELPDINLLSQ